MAALVAEPLLKRLRQEHAGGKDVLQSSTRFRPCGFSLSPGVSCTILGRITDSTGAVVVGASVRVTNMDTNVTAEAASNEDGNFQAPFLLPGNYLVVVEHPGFKRVERTGVRVSVAHPSP